MRGCLEHPTRRSLRPAMPSARGTGVVAGMVTGLTGLTMFGIVTVLATGAATASAAAPAGPTAAAGSAKAPVGAPVKAPVMGTGRLIGLEIFPTSAVIRGADRAQQLVVTGRYENGGVRDLTGQAKFSFSNAGVAKIDDGGEVEPKADGKTVITAEVAGLAARSTITVESMGTDLPINFTNEIIPVFSKLGCNSGGCHGKSGGQNGFRLSLLGFEPALDHETLTRESRGRRVFPAAPERSLLLLKGTAGLPHGGGKRMEPDSPEYKLVTRWIRTGMPFGSDKDPKVVRISIEPPHRIVGLKGRQQITVTAHYSDGTIEDVTRRAEYTSNDQEIATIDERGLVQTLDLPGEGSVMARYLGHVAVFRGTVPLGAPMEKFARAKPSNFVDKHVFAKLDQLGIPASDLCSDEEFIRRAGLDITGTLPSAAEVAAFLADKAPDKRAKLVDALLDRPEYATYFAVKWSDILRNQKGRRDNQGGNSAAVATAAFHAWIKRSLAENMPYDEFVRSIVAATGNIVDHPPTAWYRELNRPELLVDDTAQAFLGTRIQCARCHHHPFEKWSQDDYWGFASFYARVGRKTPPNGRMGGGNNNAERPVFLTRTGLTTNPNTSKAMKPKGLDSEELTLGPDEDPRQKLADWMADPKNPFFAPAIANRYWAHFFSRGIVEPIDDMRVTNPPTNPELLSALAADFVAHKFDLKHLVRTICNSTTYQLAAMPNEFNKTDKQNFARYYPRRMTAEVLLDAVDALTGTQTAFQGLPAGMRAIDLIDEAQSNYFLTVFGKPKRDSACECERSPDANLAQSLHLLNSAELQAKLTSGSGRAAKLAADPRPDAEKITELWLIAYARKPQPAELQTAEGYIARKIDPKNKAASAKQAWEDVIWALMNTKEFLFNH